HRWSDRVPRRRQRMRRTLCANGARLRRRRSSRRTPPRATPLHREHVLDVLQVTDSTDLLAARVVDADLRTDVAGILDLAHADFTVAGEQLDHLVLRDVALVRERDDQPARIDAVEQLAHRSVDLATAIERAGTLAHVDALLRDAVHRGLVPTHQRLPDVIVGE